MALRYFGTEIREKQLVRVLKDLGFFVTPRTGVYASELGLIGLRFGYNVRLEVPPTALPNVLMWNGRGRADMPDDSVIRQRLLSMDSRVLSKRVVRGLYSYVRAGGEMLVHETRASDICKSTHQGAVVILKVVSSEYYRCYERWKHFLVAVPRRDSFTILDSYSEGIRKDYPVRGESYIDFARNYDWSEWHDMILSLKPVSG